MAELAGFGDNWSSEDWNWFKETFVKLIEADPSHRAALINAAANVRPEFVPLLESIVERYEAVTDAEPLAEWIRFGIGANRPILSEGEIIADRYRILSFLDQGGFSEVYKAVDQDNESTPQLALKVLRRVSRNFDDFFERARRVDHANACRLFTTGTHQKSEFTLRFVTMELLRGTTLARWLYRELEHRSAIPEREARPLILQLAAGLGAIHGAGLIHGDLKPANVMLDVRDADLRPVITDFGLSTAGSKPAFSLEWMAPEQFSPEIPLSQATDVYAFGLILHEMLTGSRYLPGGSFDTLRAARLTPRMQSVAEQCLARDSNARYSDGNGILRALSE